MRSGSPSRIAIERRLLACENVRAHLNKSYYYGRPCKKTCLPLRPSMATVHTTWFSLSQKVRQACTVRPIPTRIMRVIRITANANPAVCNLAMLLRSCLRLCYHNVSTHYALPCSPVFTVLVRTAAQSFGLRSFGIDSAVAVKQLVAGRR
jgi:hypothetical protein